MRLYDEYLKRHGCHLSFVQHTRTFALLFRADEAQWDSRWIVLKSEWHQGRGETGHYEFVFSRPNHDGQRRSHLFTQRPKTEIEWDEYDKYLTEWPHSGLKPLTREEAGFEAWQIFQFCHDTWITKQPYEIQDIFFDSIDMDRSRKARKTSQEQILLYLRQEYPTILHGWKYDILGPLAYYADWLVDIIERSHGTQNQKEQGISTGLWSATCGTLCVGCETAKDSPLA